jgi:DNA polymerase III alpha subunit
MHLPSSIEQLAMFIALLRPGKRHLIGKSWQTIEAEIWIPTEKYYFKKSHAIAYATSIVVQLNLLASQSIECS